MMGQGEVLKLIDDLKFTTHCELCEMNHDISEGAMTKALGKLTKHNEIKSFKISRQQVYFSLEFYEELKI